MSRDLHSDSKPNRFLHLLAQRIGLSHEQIGPEQLFAEKFETISKSFVEMLLASFSPRGRTTQTTTRRMTRHHSIVRELTIRAYTFRYAMILSAV